jgi:hypothetical protein
MRKHYTGSKVNAQLDPDLNHNKEQDLCATFVNEKVSKMIDGKIRQISLLLTDKQKNCYTVLPKEKIDIKSTKNDKASLHNQAAAIRAATLSLNHFALRYLFLR